jgi:two-component system, response regulator PdtaR
MSGEVDLKTTIFVVDDDRLVLATLSSDLQRAGYEVRSFESGISAIEAYKQSQPDLVLLDIRMPGMDGIEIAKEMLRFEFRPILILSAYDDADIVGKSIASGVSGYLVKPLQPSQLIPAIETSIARSKDVDKLLKNNNNLVSNTEKNRLISTAVGILMERAKMDRDQAFDNLRRFARSQRRPLAEISEDLVKAISTANQTGIKQNPD